MVRAAIFLFLLFAIAAAEPSPQATGEPESVLAGIDVHHTTIAAIQKIYGQQDAMYAVPPNPYPAGTKLYKWGRLTVTLKVLTEPAPSGSGEVIRAVEVEGEGEPGDKTINKTGRGLRLGAKASEISKLYGVDSGGGTATIKWDDGTTLVVTLNGKNRVSKLELRAASGRP